MRYMMLVKVDPSKAPAAGPSAEMMTEMGKLIDEMAKAGVLLDTGGLRPAEEGTVLHLSGGKQTVLDGPFTEAKEIVGGYCIVQVKSQEEALEWASRFLSVHDDEWELSSEIRQIVEPQ
ncbi:YciI family protein [Streptomyces sp. NBC_00669]|uniref:YciI family protein n=1 Tax=unclassified Streptomyces TaxID=2593676 RepID=UPI002E37D0E8|nr:YciI family protein [Streptomyces sp. NBC_00669]